MKMKFSRNRATLIKREKFTVGHIIFCHIFIIYKVGNSKNADQENEAVFS